MAERTQSQIFEDKLKFAVRKILVKLGIKHYYRGDYIQCACPIHGSDNPTSLTIYLKSGKWICWSNHCEEGRWGLQNLLEGACIAAKVDPRSLIQMTEEALEGQTIMFEPEPETREIRKINISEAEIRKRLHIPSEYYIKRGFSEATLSEWMVGDCFENGMANRAVVSVFDIDGDFIGCSGRSHKDKSYITKWRHSKGLPTSLTFFGINRAKEEIIKTKTCILVEGFSDVIRLHEYGFKNAISPFGIKLTNNQSKLLKSLGVKNIILAFDPDPPVLRNGIWEDGPGPKAAKRIYEKFHNQFNIKLVTIPCDPDELSIEQAKFYFK